MRLPFKAIYLLFFFSGTAGLIYEIVWGRLLVLIFGSTTSSFVAVISAFLGGLAIGSLVFGRVADRYKPKKLIKIYSFLELGVALSAVMTVLLIPQVRNLYPIISPDTNTTAIVLASKFIISILILFTPTFLMGATLPTLVCLLKTQYKSSDKSVSLLYAVNTLGAVCGVLLAAYFLIEIYGLSISIYIAAGINILIATTSNFLNIKNSFVDHKVSQLKRVGESLSQKAQLYIFLFAISGLVNIAYEILWTRILTPSLGTFVYAFASVLALYLLGIAIGSFIYQTFMKILKSACLAFALCQLGIGLFAILSIATTHKFPVDNLLKVSVFILPATLLMGLTFPVIINIINPKKNEGKIVGFAYFANTIGSIIGGFAASFLLIPVIGTSASVVLLSLVNFAVALIFVSQSNQPKLRTAFSVSLIALIVFTLGVYVYKKDRLQEIKTDELILYSKYHGYEYSLKEDEVASTLAMKNQSNQDQRLIIDGIATTSKVIETKIMAHLPIALHNDPKRVLVIAFGMGTTFRSSLSYDIQTDAVELVPSVPKLMSFFHSDAEKVLQNPKGKVILNDGRNYAYLTKQKYDIVVIDPPPPFNASGTTVLHSEEFYKDLAKILNKDGIVGQWIYYYSTEEYDIDMAINSFVNVFPYVEVFRIKDGVGGLFLEGSFSPIITSNNKLLKHKQFKKADEDLKENGNKDDLADLVYHVSDRDTLLGSIKNVPLISDDHPKTEYFMLRHLTSPNHLLIGNNAKEFLRKISFK